MTIMGMAASQARFLGLTARKSNTEYQGQQVNQERTALANESANIYSQMSNLTVPVPPSTSDYYETSYVLDDSAFGNSSDCKMIDMIKNNSGTDKYTVKLSYSEKTSVGNLNATYQVSKISREKLYDDQENEHYKYTSTISNSKVTYDQTDNKAYTLDDGSDTTQKIEKNKIYEIDDTTKNFNLSGYNEAVEVLKEDGSYKEGDTLYFYQDTSGKNCYMTEEQLISITFGAFDDADSEKSSIEYSSKEKYVQLAYATTQNKDYTIDVQATLEQNSNGRYTSIAIDDDQEGVPSSLQGATFSISTTQEVNQEKYDEAYSDYEYLKDVYEQTVSDLNAQTEVIQQEDKQLELKLDQLDTEQKAISTDMDQVKDVIKKNVESTFKTFA